MLPLLQTPIHQIGFLLWSYSRWLLPNPYPAVFDLGTCCSLFFLLGRYLAQPPLDKVPYIMLLLAIAPQHLHILLHRPTPGREILEIPNTEVIPNFLRIFIGVRRLQRLLFLAQANRVLFITISLPYCISMNMYWLCCAKLLVVYSKRLFCRLL